MTTHSVTKVAVEVLFIVRTRTAMYMTLFSTHQIAAQNTKKLAYRLIFI